MHTWKHKDKKLYVSSELNAHTVHKRSNLINDAIIMFNYIPLNN